ncbi:MAG TPA: serine/threonine-protein kinase [Coleofasciculaceae cyanobacterium]
MSRYKIVRELGCNREGGRITSLATDTSLNPPQQVVIKEFRFALVGANWSAFKAYQREIEVLQQLEHPRIPRYLDSFETKSGFCLVQEYKNAPCLAVRRSFNPEDIKQIAVSVLEILVYLQHRVPPIIHRDIKPENVLVDKKLNAYLVDFGFARIRGGELALSSVAAGTPGFMPPEEQFGRPLTEASDLYSLGATLICLLSGTRSVDVGKLIDDDYRFNFKGLVPQLSPRFVGWLTKMVEPNLKNRYANATIALEALKPIQVKGGAIGLEALVRAMKLRMPTTVLGLLTVLVLLGSGVIIYQRTQENYQRAQGKYRGLQGIYQPTQENYEQAKSDCKRAQAASSLKYLPEPFKLRVSESVKQLLTTHKCPGCMLDGANLMGADLKGANLKQATLTGTNLIGANLEGANLEGAKMPYVCLGNANLKGANLKNAYLDNASLQGADLRGANLETFYLKDTNLEGAKLKGAKIRGGPGGGPIF